MAKKKKVSKKPAPKASKSRKTTKKSKDHVIPIQLPVETINFYKKVAKMACTNLNTVLLVVVGLQVIADLERRKDEEDTVNSYMADAVGDDRKEFGQ